MHLLRLVCLCLLGAAVYSQDSPARWGMNYSAHVTLRAKRDQLTQLQTCDSVSRRCLFPGNSDAERDIVYEPVDRPIKTLKFLHNGKKQRNDFESSMLNDGDDVFLSDTKVHLLHFAGPFRQGDLIGYTYTSTIPEVECMPRMIIPNCDSLISCRLTFHHPENTDIALRYLYSREGVNYTISRPSSTATVFSFAPRGRAMPLQYYPYNDQLAMLLPVVTWQGKLVTPNSPETFVGWYGKTLSLQPNLPSPQADSLVSAIGVLPTPVDKLRALHDWVRTNIRYLIDDRNTHGIYPHPPGEVLALGYGDCKDRAYLICALARRLGLTVYMGLVSSDMYPALAVIDRYFFDHVICYYDNDGESVFFDPTARYNPFDDPPDDIIGHQALILDPEHPRETIITATAKLPSLDLQISAHCDSLKTSEADITLRGDLLASYRYTDAEQTDLSAEDVFDRIIGRELTAVTLRDYRIIDVQPRQMVISAVADLSRAVVVSPTAFYVPHTLFRVADAGIFTRESDSLPVYFDHSQHARAAIRLRGTGVALADSSAAGDSLSGFFSSCCRSDSSACNFTYTVDRVGKVFSGPAKAAALSFCRQYLAAKKAMFILQKGTK